MYSIKGLPAIVYKLCQHQVQFTYLNHHIGDSVSLFSITVFEKCKIIKMWVQAVFLSLCTFFFRQ